MAERTEASITIDAPAAEIMEVIGDFERYPEWLDIMSASVVKRDSQGRAKEVEMALKAPMLGDIRYVLAYRYAARDGGCSWTTKEILEGGINDIEGEYVLEPLADDRTEVTYRMSLELKMKVPGFLRKQGERQIVKQALDNLKKRVEG